MFTKPRDKSIMLSKAKIIVIKIRIFGVRYTNLDAIIFKLLTSQNLSTVKAAVANTNIRKIWFAIKIENIKIIPFPK